jgi:hypothetical protein
MNDIIASGTIQSLKLLFQKKVERNVIIDPFSCLVKLSLLKYLDSGTKISIYQNRIHFNSPSYIQGIIRFMYGDNREHLHNLYLPIQKSVEWFWDEKNEDMTYVFNNAIVGLKMLKYAYNEYATIQHTIDYYIIIMMQKNSILISKIGINLLDIDKITNCMIDCSSSNNSNNSNDNTQKIDSKNDSGKNDSGKNDSSKNDSSKNDSSKNDSSKNDPSKNNNTNNTNTNNNNNTNNNKNKKSGNIKNPNNTNNDEINNDEITKGDLSNASNLAKNNTINAIDIRDSIVLSQKKDDDNNINNINKLQIHNKDIHKFLFELWNTREIGIVINLYKEMETKQKGYERDNIYSNIMSYCSMKENKLFEYIQEHSSVL